MKVLKGQRKKKKQLKDHEKRKRKNYAFTVTENTVIDKCFDCLTVDNILVTASTSALAPVQNKETT